MVVTGTASARRTNGLVGTSMPTIHTADEEVSHHNLRTLILLLLCCCGGIVVAVVGAAVVLGISTEDSGGAPSAVVLPGDDAAQHDSLSSDIGTPPLSARAAKGPVRCRPSFAYRTFGGKAAARRHCIQSYRAAGMYTPAGLSYSRWAWTCPLEGQCHRVWGARLGATGRGGSSSEGEEPQLRAARAWHTRFTALINPWA